MIKFFKKTMFIVFFMCCIGVHQSIQAKTYYSKASGNADATSSWGTTTNGTGASPSNFSTAGDIFILRAASTLVLDGLVSEWTIGAGVTLQIEGVLNVSGLFNTLTINGTVIFTGINNAQINLSGFISTFTLGDTATLITKNTNGISGTNCSISNGAILPITILPSTANYQFNGTTAQATQGLPDLTSGGSLTIANTTAAVTIASAFTNGTGATVTINSKATLTTTGAISNNGIINNAGSFINSGSITNTGTINNSGILQKTGGAFTNSSGNVINLSTATKTGYLLSTTSVANVTQQRYLTSNQRGWRLLSNPLSDITFGVLAANSTTPFTLGNNASGAYVSATDMWTNGVDTDIMASKKAYKVFIRGRNTDVTGLVYNVHPPANVTIAIKGTASNTAPAPITTVAGQYYLVANPYTAPVSVASILAASSNLSHTVSYYNPTKGSSGTGTDLEVKKGGYHQITTVYGATPGSANDVVLPPMGAIFVQAIAAGTINVPTSAIYTGSFSNLYAHKTNQNKETLSTNELSIQVLSNGIEYDQLHFKFKTEETAISTIEFGKQQNTVLDFYSLQNGKEMSVLEPVLTPQTIPLGIWSSALQDFSFYIAKNTIPEAFEVVLEDKLLQTNTIITAGTQYNFSINNTTTSQGVERFALTVKEATALSVTDEVFDTAIAMWPNPATTHLYLQNNQSYDQTIYKIYNSKGQLVYTQQALVKETLKINVNNWSPGLYLVQASSYGKTTTKKLLIQ
jgi:hypothetical protein